MVAKLFTHLHIAYVFILQRYKSDESVALKLIGTADNSCLCNGFKGNKRAFDFTGAKAVTRNVDHVINTSHDPDITVFILSGTVTGKVHAGEFRPVG